MSEQPGHQIAFISDAHPDIGDAELARARVKLLDDLKTDPAVRLIVYVGDCFGDLQCGTASELLKSRQLMDWYAKVGGIARDKQAPRQVIVLGNHDRDLGRKRGATLRARLPVDGSVDFHARGVDGEKLDPALAGWYVTHGDEYDWTTTMWNFLLLAGRTLLGERGIAKLAQWLIDRHFHGCIATPGQARRMALEQRDPSKVRRDTDRYEKTIPGIHRRLWICAQQKRKTVMFGHTHYDFAGTKPLGWMATLNPGALDAIDAMTYARFYTRGNVFRVMEYDSESGMWNAVLKQTLAPRSAGDRTP